MIATPIVVLTGAGISAESGVPTFRGAGGLWRNFRAEDLATPQAFQRDPKLVWEWYLWRRSMIAACEPNAAHRTLVEMEDFAGDEFTLITQNIDGLHEAAGSRNMLRLHGSLWSMRCVSDGKRFADRRTQFDEIPPRCSECGALLRPDVVWFGETLDGGVLQAALDAAQHARIMIVIGTSALVYPAAALPLWAMENGAHLIEVNPDDTPLSKHAHTRLRGPAAIELPRWWVS